MPNTRGMALVIVLALTTVLLLSALAVFRSGREYRSQIKRAIRELQSQYITMGAIQHAELKVRYFPTELYDASEYAQGKNPYFDFTELTDAEYAATPAFRRVEYRSSSPHVHLAGLFNPGPRFLTDGTLAADPNKRWFQLDGLAPADANPVLGKAGTWFPSTGWPKEEGGAYVRNCDLYLWKYRSDLSSVRGVQDALSWSLASIQDENTLDIANENRFPYDASYEIISLRVMAVAGQRRMSEEAVAFTAIGQLTVGPETFSHRMEKVLRVKRR